jgi:uncharacterized membrane protein YphA (DoxX/SURF4 family)
MIKNVFKKSIKLWNKFFFEPISPITICFFRIPFGIVVFLSNLGRYPIRDLFYSDAGIIKYHTMDGYFPAHPFFYFRWLPDEPLLTYFFIGLLIVNILFILGLFTRLSTILLFLGLMCLSNRNFFNDNAGDHLLRINLFYLMFSHCGDCFSLDRWLKRRRGKAQAFVAFKPPWAQRMLQLQLSYLYIQTVDLKLHGNLWLNGTAMYYALHYVELKRFDFKFLFYTLLQIKLATYLTLLAEALSGTLIWVQRFRYPIIGAALLFHLGINLTMQFPIFQYVMMTSLLTFIYPEDLQRWLSRSKDAIKHFKAKKTPQDLFKQS